MKPFMMAPDPALFRNEESRVLDIPTTLPDKNTLLSWYAAELEIPEYFGANWDALDECLRDLSWINERRIVLYHKTIPLESSPTEQKIYINVLVSSTLDWKPGESHELLAAFHPDCELRLRTLIRMP